MRPLACLALCTLLLLPATARSRKGKGDQAAPGDFDYFLLSLSWAPDFCDKPNVNKDPRECGPGRRLGFVVHGLWPQQDDGGHPSQCAPARPVAQDTVQRMLAYIPGEGLIQHEWRDHGTCSGMSPAAYFDTVRKAYESVTVPGELKQLNQQLHISPREIEAKFVSANPRLRDSIRVTCSGGELAEVRICFSKNLSPHACGVHDAGCRDDSLTVLPVR